MRQFVVGEHRYRFRLVAHPGDAVPQLRDKSIAVGQVRRFDVEDLGEAPLLQGDHVDAVVHRIGAGRVADDVDQPVERMQAAEQVVVLTIGARQEAGKMPEADALEA
jgi:hypothetical protein